MSMTPKQRKSANETSSAWHKKNRARLKDEGFVMKRTWVHKSEIDRYDDLVETLERKPPPSPKKGASQLKLPGLD